jgi:membrane protease YdiL (CAAX protease family)
MLIFLFLYGLFFGAMYDLSRNILFTGILHGTFNFQPIVLAGSQGQPDLTVTWFVLPLAALAIWGYRRLAKQTRPEDFRPQVLE